MRSAERCSSISTQVLGLSLDAPAAVEVPLPDGAPELLERRAAARAARDWPRPMPFATSSPPWASTSDMAAGQETTIRR